MWFSCLEYTARSVRTQLITLTPAFYLTLYGRAGGLGSLKTALLPAIISCFDAHAIPIPHLHNSIEIFSTISEMHQFKALTNSHKWSGCFRVSVMVGPGVLGFRGPGAIPTPSSHLPSGFRPRHESSELTKQQNEFDVPNSVSGLCCAGLRAEQVFGNRCLGSAVQGCWQGEQIQRWVQSISFAIDTMRLFID